MTTAEPPRPSGGDEDIDAEFERMMAGLDFEEPSAPAAEADASATLDADVARADAHLAESADEEPVTIESLFADQEPAIAVVATSVASAKALAGAIRLGREARADGLEIPPGSRVHMTSMGAIAAGPLQEEGAHALAAITSTALQRSGVVLFWRKGDRMTATRYREGERGEDISPAIVMGAMDDSIEQLMLGAMRLNELDEGLDPAAISREQALTWIAEGRKRR